MGGNGLDAEVLLEPFSVCVCPFDDSNHGICGTNQSAEYDDESVGKWVFSGSCYSRVGKRFEFFQESHGGRPPEEVLPQHISMRFTWPYVDIQEYSGYKVCQ